MNYQNQREQIAKHLRSGKTITNYQAFREFNITRLSAVIFDIRQDPDKYGLKVLSIDKNNGLKGRERKSWTEYKGEVTKGQLSFI